MIKFTEDSEIKNILREVKKKNKSQISVVNFEHRLN